MATWVRNQITNLYNPVLATLPATRDMLAERLQNLHETVLLYNTMRALI